ncbi:MAG: helix-turn-helix domain-containing protein [Phycisphaerae bacterium]
MQQRIGVAEMDAARQALAERIKTLRRRHYGQRGGAAEFAAHLGISAEEYKSFERGTVPSGEMLVNICEQTGEDMQWLLTGVSSRGTVVISNARVRHQAFLGRLAQFLEENPDRARPFESLLDLLSEARATNAISRNLPVPPVSELIPIYAADAVPAKLPDDDDDPPGARMPLAQLTGECTWSRASFVEVGNGVVNSELVRRSVDVLTSREPAAQMSSFVHLPSLARSFPQTFAVAVNDEAMTPCVEPGDAVVVTPGIAPRLGAPALLRMRAGPARVRVWLGKAENGFEVAALHDPARETIAPADVCWSLEVLYVVARAA